MFKINCTNVINVPHARRAAPRVHPSRVGHASPAPTPLASASSSNSGIAASSSSSAMSSAGIVSARGSPGRAPSCVRVA
eukprot:31220-Pelagococcus_subviridis.AAC.4